MTACGSCGCEFDEGRAVQREVQLYQMEETVAAARLAGDAVSVRRIRRQTRNRLQHAALLALKLFPFLPRSSIKSPVSLQNPVSLVAPPLL